MTYFKYFSIYILIVAHVQAEDLREFTFTVYGENPIRSVEYSPLSEEALKNDEEPVPAIEIKTHVLSRMGPYTYKGGNRVLFKEKETSKVVASVSVPESADRWLFVFLRNPNYKKENNTNKYLVYPFDDSKRNLPNNGLVFLNISGKKLDGLLEKKRVSFAAGESSTYRVQESLPVNLWTLDRAGEKLLPALIKTYKFQEDYRYLMIFFPPALRGSADLDVRLLSEAID